MFSLNIGGEKIFFSDIKLEHLPLILKWYNKVDDFKFATGIDHPISLEQLTKKYAEVAICSNEFFVGINTRDENVMVGILKGRLEYKSKHIVWISSIVIDPDYQNRGLGSAAIELLLNHLKAYCSVKTAYLAVIEENVHGRAFWLKHGFQEMRKIENHLRLQDKQQNVYIMNKHI